MNFPLKDVGVPDNITRTLPVISAITSMSVEDMRATTMMTTIDVAI